MNQISTNFVSLILIIVSLFQIQTSRASEKMLNVSPGQQQAGVRLCTKMQPGLALSFKHQTKVDKLFTGSGIKQQIISDVTVYLQIRVVSTGDDGSKDVVLVHNRITSDTYTQPAQFERQKYDSSKPETIQSDAALPFQPVIDKPIKLRVSPSGQITVVSGVDGLKVPERARPLFDQIFSNAAIESTYADLFQITSSIDVITLDDSWHLQREQPDEFGKKILQLNLTLSKIEGSNAIIEETGRSTIEMKNSPKIPKVRLKNSSIKGNWIWDIETGTLRSLNRRENETLQIRTLDGVDLRSTYIRTTVVSRETVEVIQKMTATILGATEEKVKLILKEWESREDRLSTEDTRVFRFTKDVTMVIAFRDNKVIGVGVIDRPGAGVFGISESRFRELVQLLGEEPIQNDIRRDSRGRIREFYVGDTRSW